MATLNDKIRKYIQDIRKGGQPNIEIFFTDKRNQDAIDDWLVLYSSAKKARRGLLQKFRKLQKMYQRKGKRSLAGQDDVNWERCYEDAITKQAFLVNGSALLRSTVPRLRLEISRRVEGTGSSSTPTPIAATTTTTENQDMEEDRGGDDDNSNDSDDEVEETFGIERESSRRNSTYTIPSPVTIGSIPVVHQDLPAGFNITDHWHRYKLNSLSIANKQNLHISSNLQKVMSLYHVMLVCPDINDNDIIEIFGADILDAIYTNLKNKYYDRMIEFDTSLFKEIKAMVDQLKEGDKEMNRTKALIQLANMMERTQDHNIQILQILINCVTKLSNYEKNYIVKETELITNYLDPVLSPMFHDPKNNRLFRWLNQRSNVSEEESRRPDGGMNVVNQLQNTYALGFVEVKAIDAAKNHALTHMDTLRLALFCKSALDKNEVKCAIGVQAVGTYVTFFFCTIEQEALYPFMKIGRLDVPTSFETLPNFLLQLDTCARIINTYNTFCVRRRREESAGSMIRASLTHAQLMDILHLETSDTSPSLKLTPTV